MPHIFEKTSQSSEDQPLNPWANDPILDPTHELPKPEEKLELESPKVGSKKPYEQYEDEEDHDPIKTYFDWTAPSRPFKKKDKSYFQTIAIIIVLLILISIFAGEYMMVAVLLAFSFVAYVMGLIPPDDIKYKISTQGINISGHFYFWDYLDSFWISKKDDQNVLYILTHLNFPGQLVLVLGDQDPEKIKRVIARFLPYHEVEPKTLLQSWADKLQQWFPLEKQPS